MILIYTHWTINILDYFIPIKIILNNNIFKNVLINVGTKGGQNKSVTNFEIQVAEVFK